MIDNIYKVGLYCRLSSDDGNVGDSGSIITQKMILEKYCEEHNLEIIDIYVDDGFSGLNYNRPSFQRMIADIEIGKITPVKNNSGQYVYRFITGGTYQFIGSSGEEITSDMVSINGVKLSDKLHNEMADP